MKSGFLPTKIFTALVLGLLFLGSLARVIGHPLLASQPPSLGATHVASTNINLPQAAVEVGQLEFTVELATTDQQKAEGLSDRSNLAAGHGMLFVFRPAERPSFWMKDMRFPLDIVWITNGRVAGISRQLPAPQPGTKLSDLPTYAAPSTVDYVLEVNAGAADGLQPGDRMTVNLTPNI